MAQKESTRTLVLKSAYNSDDTGSPCFIHATQLSGAIKANGKTLGIYFAKSKSYREKPGYKNTFK